MLKLRPWTIFLYFSMLYKYVMFHRIFKFLHSKKMVNRILRTLAEHNRVEDIQLLISASRSLGMEVIHRMDNFHTVTDPLFPTFLGFWLLYNYGEFICPI